MRTRIQGGDEESGRRVYKLSWLVCEDLRFNIAFARSHNRHERYVGEYTPRSALKDWLGTSARQGAINVRFLDRHSDSHIGLNVTWLVPSDILDY